MTGEARPSHQVDLEHPWLGLASFSEKTRDYFFGRDAEVAELLQRLRLHPLLVLFGRSGLGKTSLLRARVVPELEKFGDRPALYRISYREGEEFPLDQLLVALEVLGQLDVPGLALPEDPASRLWLHFHYRDGKNRVTHLILDQFEEIFTFGADWPGADLQVREALAILTQGAIPSAVEALLDEGEILVKHFQIDVPPLPVVLSVRQDYFFTLNRWRNYLPQICQNTFELRALRGPDALNAVFKPGELRCHYRDEVKEENKADTGLQPIASKETAERIVRFVAKKSHDVPIEEIEAVPPILSLLCRELNECRFTKPLGSPEEPSEQIVFREDETDINTIITSFYERCVAGRPEAVRMFIEEALVSYSGARLAQDEKSILSCFDEGWEISGAPDDRRAPGFGDADKARACLNDLVNERLLTSLGGGDNPNYELIHDLLATVVERSRTAREERFAKDQADRRAEADRKAKDEAENQARLARRWVCLVSVALAVASLAALFAFTEWYNATKATRETRKTKHDSNNFITFMHGSMSGIFGKAGRMDLMREINVRVITYYKDHPPEPEDLDAKHTNAVAMLQDGELLREEGQRVNVALDETQKALEIFRTLRAQNPDNPSYQRDIALGYERLGDVYHDQGNLERALKNYNDGLAIREKLATQAPENPDLQRALSLSNDEVGGVLRQKGDLAGALKKYDEGLAIAQKLTTQDPSNASWQRDLSVSYNEVGDVLSDQGDLTGALKNYNDGLAIREKLATQAPDSADWQRDLYVSYNALGGVLRQKGDLEGALKNYNAGLAIAQKLSTQDPDDVGWQRLLSTSYNALGDVLSGQGDLTGALKNYNEGLAIAQKLTTQDPDNVGWQRLLSTSYNALGDVLSGQGDLTGALKNYNEGLAIAQKLTTQDPDNVGWQRLLSANYNAMGYVQSTQADLNGALKNYDKALAIAQKLANLDSSNTGAQSDLARCYQNLGDVQKDQGDLAGALKRYRDSLAIAEKLAKQDAGNAGWQRDLFASNISIGDVLRAQGDFDGAFQRYRDSLPIAERLVNQDPDNADWQYIFAVANEGFSYVQREKKDFPAALKSSRDCQTALKKLVQRDPSNAGWQRALSASYEDIGDVQMDQKDLEGALKSYLEGLAITKKLIQQSSDNFGWQWDLSDWYADIGKVLRGRGDLVRALKNYRDSNSIREMLAARDPSNAGWQGALGWIYWQTGAVWWKVEPQSKGKALAMVEKGHDVLRQLKTRAGLTVEQQRWLDEMEADLRKMREAK